MIIIIMFSILLSTINLISIRDADKEQRRIARTLDLIRLGEIIRRDVDLYGLNDFEKAVAIRHYIYSTHALGKDSGSLSIDDLSDAWNQITNQEASVICGWLAIMYISALESQGIPARYVGIFSADSSPYDSHASVEFYDGNQWIISDPTFNIMFISGDYYLSWSDVYNGLSYTVTTNGQGHPDQWNNYYIGIDNLLKHVVIHNDPLIILGDWGGYIDGANVARDTYSEFHQFMNEGPLR